MQSGRDVEFVLHLDLPEDFAGFEVHGVQVSISSRKEDLVPVNERSGARRVSEIEISFGGIAEGPDFIAIIGSEAPEEVHGVSQFPVRDEDVLSGGGDSADSLSGEWDAPEFMSFRVDFRRQPGNSTIASSTAPSGPFFHGNPLIGVSVGEGIGGEFGSFSGFKRDLPIFGGRRDEAPFGFERFAEMGVGADIEEGFRDSIVEIGGEILIEEGSDEGDGFGFADDAEVTLIDGSAAFEERLGVAGDDRGRFPAVRLDLQDSHGPITAGLTGFEFIRGSESGLPNEFESGEMFFVAVRWSVDDAIVFQVGDFQSGIVRRNDKESGLMRIAVLSRE